MELSQCAHYDRLASLASSTGAALIIIHCKTEKEQGGKDHNGGGFGFGHVPTVIIDATKPFIAEDFAPKILRAAEERKNVDLSIYNPEGSASDAHPFLHAHDFVLSLEPKKENLNCTKCENLITLEPTYHCVECDDFVLHKECVESPKWDTIDEKGGCQFCHEFRSNCPDCLL